MEHAIDAARVNGNTDWLHISPAWGSAVPGVFINVFAPKALRTVVGITASRYTHAASLTRKIFNFPYKTFHRYSR
ncbi:MAG: hypothetical protein UY62_C0003G0010 [Parcubacteria group bacterium GW2011_GWF2_50_9]|nr:MAG: hypothetical protein UY62_C0003G0010 [Parcubacteria group bacterium GW2011_GWF2_50_9]